MKHLALAVLLFISATWTNPSHADPQCQATIDMSTTNMTTSWTLSPTLIAVRNMTSIFAVNSSTARAVLVNCGGSASSAPLSSSKSTISVGGPAGDSTWALDNVNGGSACWYKADGGTISSGIFKLCVSGN